MCNSNYVCSIKTQTTIKIIIIAICVSEHYVSANGKCSVTNTTLMALKCISAVIEHSFASSKSLCLGNCFEIVFRIELFSQDIFGAANRRYTDHSN